MTQQSDRGSNDSNDNVFSLTLFTDLSMQNPVLPTKNNLKHPKVEMPRDTSYLLIYPFLVGMNKENEISLAFKSTKCNGTAK